MAIAVDVPKDLSGIKTKVALNLTKKQLICFSAAAVTGIPLYLLSKGTIGTEAASVLMITDMLPFFFFAMYEKDGLHAEEILQLMIRHRYLTPGIRRYKAKNRSPGFAETKKIKREVTAQQTLTFKKIYSDGTCKVSSDYYTRMVRFEDLNYCLQDIPMQAELLGLYSQFINYFEPGIHFQIFLFNRRVSRKSLISRFDIPLRGDRFDPIRKEFSGILKDQYEKGKNGIVKEKYIIFGIEADSLKEAREKLKSIEEDVVRNLANIGTKATALSGKERVELLHEFYHQDTMKPLRFSYRDMVASGNTIKDYVAPRLFDFRSPMSFRTGKMFGCVRYFDITASQINDELLQRFLDIDENITISIHMQTMDPVKASKMLKNKLSNIQKMKIDEQKKAVRSGYDMDIMPADIVTFENDALELFNDLNSSNQKIIRMTFLIACFGRTEKKMENLLQRVSGIVQQANCSLRCFRYRQEEGMNAVSPVGINEVETVRILTTKSSAIFIPFNTQELFMKGQALYYGLNALSNNMILADRKKLRTPNGVILGTPGSGKSFSAKREIVGCFLVTEDDILICDPEGEYFPLVQALGGQVVRLATNSTEYLNPMDIQNSHINDREALRLKADFLITLCDMIAGGEDGLANDENGIIDRCVSKVYEEYFRDPKPERMPILEDLYNTLLKYEPKDVRDEKLAEDAKKKAVKIAQSLVLYVHGSQNYFNHRTNVDSNNRIVCFDIRDLGSQLKELGMLITQDAVWNRVSINRERKKATRYYCDEFHLLLRDKQTARYSVEMWKRFRKWGGIPTGITQNVGDFLLSPQIEGILGNSDFVYLLNQNANDQEILAEKLGLSSKQLKYVTNAEPGCGLIRFNNVTVPFVDRYPQETETFRIMSFFSLEA
ncbi:MAG: PrgI family protein [Lachnospiraceae bacterium]|nr:PrgI family protein [Lachnospiraceae bacterium]